MALPMDAWKGIEQLQPGAIERRDAVLVAVAGQPPHDLQWNVTRLGARPTDAQIAAAVTAYDQAQAARDQEAAALRTERDAAAAMDAALTTYINTANPTAAQWLAISKQLVRAVRFLIRAWIRANIIP